ncbi:hypothetical protein HPHPA9_0422 [Helicobacter pylori Hp A-9]|uniref:Uncharacterized protein n=1 Tax=Helicobacter pylori Hp A-9 TaxID=992034 RepID=J0K3G5_HELPX|nr:hypothetical protein HPHPA9_0422 [Helicobacter pylori Hp A-9]
MSSFLSCCFMVIKNTKYRHKNGLKHGVLVTLFKGIGVFCDNSIALI